MSFYSVPQLVDITGKTPSVIYAAINEAEKPNFLPGRKQPLVVPIRRRGIRGLRLTENDAREFVSLFWGVDLDAAKQRVSTQAAQPTR